MMICLESSSKRKYIFDILFFALFRLPNSEKTEQISNIPEQKHSHFVQTFLMLKVFFILLYTSIFLTQIFSQLLLLFFLSSVTLLWTESNFLRLKQILFISYLPRKPSLFLKIWYLLLCHLCLLFICSFQTKCKQGIVDPMLSIWGQQLIVHEDSNQ